MGGHSSIAHISGTSFIAAAHVNVAFVLNNYFEVQSFLEGVEKYKINVGFVTPTRLLDLLNSKLYEQYDLSSMKMLFCGGSPLPDTIKEPATKALGIAGINQTYARRECIGYSNMATELRYAIVKDGIVGSKLPNDLVVDRNWLQEVLFDGLSSDLERTVFIDHPSDRRWNARQVRDMSLKMATALDRIGLSKGKFICSYLPNNDYHALWQYGIYMAASVFVGCYWTNPYRELLHYATVSQADAILCSTENLETAKQVADELSSIKCLIVVDIDGNCDERETDGGKPIHSHSQLLKMADGDELLSQPLTTEGDPESTPASIHFSSGSTGPRKGVVRSHSNFTFILASQTPWFERGPSFIMSLHVPIAHTSGGTSTLRGAAGLTLVISEAFTLSTFLEAVQKHRIQMAILAPSALSDMVKNSATCAKYNLSSLVHVVVGGAPLPDALKGPAAQVIDHPSDRRWNARQVRDMSLKMATALDRIGLSKGKFICSYLPNNDYHALWQYGIYMAGLCLRWLLLDQSFS
ncbi:4-coumarate--CoA ligase [Halotydeus destructor]|nr:4-coumarate--CoA ligase [Halotydeus destructor]